MWFCFIPAPASLSNSASLVLFAGVGRHLLSVDLVVGFLPILVIRRNKHHRNTGWPQRCNCYPGDVDYAVSSSNRGRTSPQGASTTAVQYKCTSRSGTMKNLQHDCHLSVRSGAAFTGSETCWRDCLPITAHTSWTQRLRCVAQMQRTAAVAPFLLIESKSL